MYSNIGHKLRIVAKVIGMIGLFIALTGAILMLIANGEYFDVVLGSRCIIVGLILYVSTFPMYAFGQLVDDVRQIRDDLNSEMTDDSVNENTYMHAMHSKKHLKAKKEKRTCSKCSKLNPNDAEYCQHCGCRLI